MVNHYLFLFVLIRVYPRLSVAGSILERAVRLELTNTGFAIRRLSRLATRAVFLCPTCFSLSRTLAGTSSPDNDKLKKYIGHFSFGTEGEIRTLETSLEDSHVASYITSARGFLIFDWCFLIGTRPRCDLHRIAGNRKSKI